MERREASKALSTRKLADGGQTNGIVAAHRPCEPLLFSSGRRRNGLDQRRHRDLLKTKAEVIEPVPDANGGDRKERCYPR